jgi:tryptophan 2,3-dioxygenase
MAKKMANEAGENWWQFSIDPAVRADRARSRFTGVLDVNPEMPGGLRRLDYHTYLGLDALLGSQRPSSVIPDERVFIVTHQLMELTFKMVVFDMAVVERTLREFSASAQRPAELIALAGRFDEFWGPALTASARIAFACRSLLPTVMRLLSDPKDADETFNSVEFHRFRENLEPASGFQSAQFRLIQRALGKSNLLSVRLFPAQTYRKLYGDSTEEGVRVVDRVILRDDAAVATPDEHSPLAAVGRLDDTAHDALAKLVPSADANDAAPDAIHPSEIGRAAMLFERMLASRRKEPSSEGGGERFRADLEAAAAAENRRREGLRAARAGAQALRKQSPAGPLSRIMSAVAGADDALHGTSQDSFLSVHLRVTRERLRQIRAYAAKMGEREPSIGTGGGGIEYLGWAQRYLIPLFPALVAYRELGD